LSSEGAVAVWLEPVFRDVDGGKPIPLLLSFTANSRQRCISASTTIGRRRPRAIQRTAIRAALKPPGAFNGFCGQFGNDQPLNGSDGLHHHDDRDRALQVRQRDEEEHRERTRAIHARRFLLLLIERLGSR
jgi:hypothetical protein